MHKLTQLCNKFTMYMKRLIYIIVLLSFSLCEIKVGDPAPLFSLLDQNKKVHSLKDYKSKKLEHHQMSLIADMLSVDDIKNVSKWYSSIKIEIEDIEQ